jgi:hypothetical protein
VVSKREKGGWIGISGQNPKIVALYKKEKANGSFLLTNWTLPN